MIRIDTVKISSGLKELLQELKEGYISILGNNLVGIYIHGSVAMGCYNPEKSDVDFLVIVKDKMSVDTKKKIICLLLELSDKYPVKGLEMSIILQSVIDNFVHPTPFELHYSNGWKKDYEEDKADYSKEDEDRDLAAHITVTINRGFCLYGKKIKEAFKPIPEKYYIDSLMYDLENIKNNILENPVYNILNLCRILQYLKTKKVASKLEGGNWALKTIPAKYWEIVNKATAIYQQNEKNINWNDTDLKEYADYMMRKINDYHRKSLRKGL